MILPEDFTLHFHKPEDTPPNGQTVLVQLDGIALQGAVQYIHSWFTGEYYEDGSGWWICADGGPEFFEVLCWAELPPRVPVNELAAVPETKERINIMIRQSRRIQKR